MADHTHIVHDIRAFLASSDRTRTDDVAQLAADYAAACREANGRLRRCVEYLRRGMRSAAIHLAEVPPDLLEQVSTLDLPDAALHDWEEVCNTYGLPKPVRLMIDAAQEVNEAYALTRPLEEILARHRLLALAKAPLKERIALLRQLAQRDARNPAWDEDARSMERARLTEVAAEAVAAVKAKDPAKVDALVVELKEPGWRTPVPEDLNAKLHNAAAAIHRDRAAAELRALVPRVRQAVASESYDLCQQVLRDWCVVVQKSGVVLPKELREEIRPLNELIDREDERHEREKQYHSACRELRRAVEGGAYTVQLPDLYKTVCAFDYPVPEDLATAYRRILAAQDEVDKQESRRNFVLTAVLVAAVVLAIGGLVGVLVTWG